MKNLANGIKHLLFVQPITPTLTCVIYSYIVSFRLKKKTLQHRPDNDREHVFRLVGDPGNRAQVRVRDKQNLVGKLPVLEKRRGRVPGHVGHRHLQHEGKHTEVHQPARRTAESHHGHGLEPQQVRMISWGANDVLLR